MCALSQNTSTTDLLSHRENIIKIKQIYYGFKSQQGGKRRTFVKNLTYPFLHGVTNLLTLFSLIFIEYGNKSSIGSLFMFSNI